jgi:hypothetical protein
MLAAFAKPRGRAWLLLFEQALSPMPMLRIEMLPALHGDCILVAYGEADRPAYVLIDGGPIQAYGALRSRIERISAGRRELELFVITHVDADHIEGGVRLLGDAGLGVTFGDIWFNGWPQLAKPIPRGPARPVAAGARGPAHGEYLALRIARRDAPWNHWFGGRAIHAGIDAASLPQLTLQGGLRITVLGPLPEQLVALRDEWYKVATAAGGTPGDAGFFAPRLEAAKRYRGGASIEASVSDLGIGLNMLAAKLDASVANGSSIALLLEYACKRCALLGDAHAPGIARAFQTAARARGEQRLRLDAIKVAHHGSLRNMTPALLAAIDCDTFLISTDGSKHGHPDTAAIDLIVQHAPRPPHLLFNYLSDTTRRWQRPSGHGAADCRASFPLTAACGLAIDLHSGAIG